MLQIITNYNLSKIHILCYAFCLSKAPCEAAEIIALAVTDCTVCLQATHFSGRKIIPGLLSDLGFSG